MSKPFVLNIVFPTEEALIEFFDETFDGYPRNIALFPAEPMDTEALQDIQQYVIRPNEYESERVARPLRAAGLSQKKLWKNLPY